LTLTFLLAATLVTPAAAATPQVGTEAANSQPKPNDAFVDVHDFVFSDGEESGVAETALSDPRKAASRREWRNHQWGTELTSGADHGARAGYNERRTALHLR